jgi:hypothetical protein
VVFDEYHFGRFNNQYHAGTYFFDIHPPLGQSRDRWRGSTFLAFPAPPSPPPAAGKLVFYFVSKLAGYDHGDCAYANIGDAFSPTCKFMILRTTAALFGALTAPVLYGIARRFGASVHGAILASLFFVVDGLNLIESRLILIDSQLIFWCAVTLYVATHWWERWNLHWSAVDEWEAATGRTLSWAHQLGFPPINADEIRQLQDLWRDQRVMTVSTRLLWAVAVGVVCANAVSIKFTGLASPGMVAVESFFAAFFLRRAVPITDLLLVAGVAFATFSAYYAVHFSLLPLSGDGDGFMHIDFQRTLVGNANHDPAAPHPSFWRMLYEVGGGVRGVVHEDWGAWCVVHGAGGTVPSWPAGRAPLWLPRVPRHRTRRRWRPAPTRCHLRTLPHALSCAPCAAEHGDGVCVRAHRAAPPLGQHVERVARQRARRPLLQQGQGPHHLRAGVPAG